MVSGMLGVPLGALLSTLLREKYPRADPMICGTGLIISSVFIFATFFYARTNIFMGFAFVFLGEIALNLNWSIVADILLVNFVSQDIRPDQSTNKVSCFAVRWISAPRRSSERVSFKTFNPN